MNKNMSMDTITKSGINREVHALAPMSYIIPYYDYCETIEDLVYLNNQRGEQTQ